MKGFHIFPTQTYCLLDINPTHTKVGREEKGIKKKTEGMGMEERRMKQRKRNGKHRRERNHRRSKELQGPRNFGQRKGIMAEERK